jgi:RNA polymerase sigma-70 factor, ECF subfamily
VPELDDAITLAPVIARARAECAEVAAPLGDDELLAHLAAMRPLAELAAVADTVHAGDLLLAAGCLRRVDAALRLFEVRFVPDLRQALRTVDPSPTFGDEVLQQVRHKLFVGDAPRIASYSGTGPLGGWLRVVALREAVSKTRQHRRETPVDDALAELAKTGRSPEQELAFRQHEVALTTALRAAMAARSSRERALLRYYYCDNVGVEELGRIYRVHASTVSRWLAQARDAILADTRQRLAAVLEQSESQVDSTLGLAGGLDVSLTSLLRSA